MGRVGRSPGSDGVLGIARALQWSWAVLPALGVALLVVTPPFGNLVLPLLVTLGVLGGIYGATLRRRASQDPARTPLPVALLTAVTIYSPKRLQLGPEIAETRFPDAESADRYRYRGLRLLDHADDKYFLIPDTWTREGARLIVLRDDGATRVEFSR